MYTQYPNDITPQYNDGWVITLKKLLLVFWNAVNGVQTIPVTASSAIATPNISLLAASSTLVIPAGAKGWGVAVLTGTATINGVSVSAGFNDTDGATTGATITVTTASASTAYIRYGS